MATPTVGEAPREGRMPAVTFRRATILLLALNTVAHFLVPERSALSADEYWHRANLSAREWSSVIPLATSHPERPLQWAFVFVQSKLALAGTWAVLALLFISTSVLAVCGLWLLTEWLDDPTAGFVAASIWIVSPQIVEAFHHTGMLNVNFATALYATSMASWIRYTRSGRAGLVAASWISYGVALSWYEIGFFAPFACAVFCVSRRRRISPWLLGHVAIAAVYAAARLHARDTAGHSVGFAWDSVLAVVNQLAGAYALRTCVYGVWRVMTMPYWAVCLAAIAVAVSVHVIWRRWPVISALRVPTVAGVTAAFAALAMIAPLFLQAKGAGGRQLVLCLLFLSIPALQLVRRLGPITGAVAFTAGLLISMGNAWSVVQSSRIVASLDAELSRRRPLLATATAVVFDLRGFADHIPGSAWPLEWDLLNTYWGVELFEDWGLDSMVRAVSGRQDLQVHFAADRPRTDGDGLWVLSARGLGSRRSYHFRAVRLPRSTTILIDAVPYPR